MKTHKMVNLGQKCVICDRITAKPVGLMWKVVKSIMYQMEVVDNWHEKAEYVTFDGKTANPTVCELCWIGMLNTNEEYIWDGTKLLVFSKMDGEYHELHGKGVNVYKPTTTGQIQFEYNKRRGKWVAMPR